MRAFATLDGGVETLAELGRVEAEPLRELEELADRLDTALERDEPSWHRVGARRRAAAHQHPRQFEVRSIEASPAEPEVG